MKKSKPISCRDFPAVVKFINGKKHVTLKIVKTKLEDWVDKQEIQTKMHISDRTLLTLRQKRRIPFSSIGKKIYYYLPGILFMLETNLYQS